MEELTLVGLVILIVGTMIKEIISFLKQKALLNEETRLGAVEKGLTELRIVLLPTIKEVKEMYEWHDKSDEDGVKIWYIRKSLESVLRDNAQATSVLARNSELQTSLLKELIESQRVIMREQMLLSNELKLQQKQRD